MLGKDRQILEHYLCIQMRFKAARLQVSQIFQENHYLKKSAKLLRKVKTLKIQVIFYMLCAVLD
jgi:hypothetical protein